MGYEQALEKAWTELREITQDKNHSVRLLGDEYSIDLERQQILSLSCNVPAKAHVSIVVLHYLLQRLKGLPPLVGEWISFNQLPGGQSYYPVFKKRVISPIVKKYGAHPESLWELADCFGAHKARHAEVSVIVEILERVPVLIVLFRGDEEFGPEANVLFDQSIKDILCTEDIVVTAEFLAHSI
jgi:hypothetical protein